MSSRPKTVPPKEVAQVIVDPKSKKRYQKGKFLGKVSYTGQILTYALAIVAADLI